MSSEEHMLGHGFYNKHAQAQGAANQYALDVIAQAIHALDLSRVAGEFRIADYGSAQGRNSLLPIGTALQALASRAGGESRSISVIHTDLATNDWTTLFQTVQSSPDSYVVGRPDLSVFASGTSIYQRIFPPRHIAFGYSAITTHWLSRRPTTIPGGIWSARATGAVRAAWAAQARDDWYSFLRYRCNELVPSGQIVMVNSGAAAGGMSGAEPLVDAANQALRGMVDEGVLGADEYAAMAIPTYYRTEREWSEPFEDAAFVSENPLELKKYQEFTLDDVYLAEYARTHDVQTFADSEAAFFSAAFEPALFASLSTARQEASRRKVIDAFSLRLRALLGEDPGAHAARWVLQVMWLGRRAAKEEP